jgi:ABC-type Fe3+-hydroxamate transport system substrate-binding protein
MILKDQIGNLLEFNQPPKRIVSLVPSLTETVSAWASEKLIARTKFCIHPASIKSSIPSIGGTKNPDIKKILALKPDLIIANKEENRKEDIEQLNLSVPVWVSDIYNWETAMQALGQLAIILETDQSATSWMSEWKAQRALFQETFPPLQRNVLYLIWQHPYMSIGRDTYIHSMVELLGLNSVTGQLTRYPEVQEDWIRDIQPDFLFLSSEPYPFKEKHLQFYQHIAPRAQVMVVDGEIFSWYGVRMGRVFEYFSQLRSEMG